MLKRLIFSLAAVTVTVATATCVLAGPAAAATGVPAHQAPAIKCITGSNIVGAAYPSYIEVRMPMMVMPWYASSSSSYRENVAFRVNFQWWNGTAWQNGYTTQWVWAKVDYTGTPVTQWSTFATTQQPAQPVTSLSPPSSWAVPGYYYRAQEFFYWYASGQGNQNNPDVTDYCKLNPPLDF
jgi:hypothetical protein